LVKLHLLLMQHGLDLCVFPSNDLEQVIGQHLCACDLTFFGPT
jgi:hypothetical protein